MSLTTPVRHKPARTEMSNESPLPTPPQATHDLLRNGRVMAGAGSRSYAPGQSSEAAEHRDRQSSSPSARASTSASSRGALRLHGGANRSPSSLALSMGALPPPSTSNQPLQFHHQSHPHHRNANALGSQMGILQSSLEDSNPIASEKPTRPGALQNGSQRSASYEVSGTPRRKSEEVDEKMNTRPSYKSLAAAERRESNKENIMGGGHHQRRISSARRLSSKRSPSPTSSPPPPPSTMLLNSDERVQEGESNVQHRRPSAENEKRLAASTAAYRGSLRRSSDEAHATTSTRRRPMEDNQAHQVGQQEAGEEGQPPSAVHAMFVTPGLSSGARVLRSGHAPKQAATPWSVGRSIKRIDRHYAPDKPPRRIVASHEEEEEEEEEEVEEEEEEGEGEEEGHGDGKNGSRARQTAPPPSQPDEEKSRAGWRERRKERDKDEDLHWIRREGQSVGAGPSGESTRGGRSPGEWHGSGSDGSGRTPPMQVPLGADEDEDEEELLHDNHPRRAEHAGRRGAGGAAKEVEVGSKRAAAMQDILAARIPQVVNKRILSEGSVQSNQGPVSCRDVPYPAPLEEENVDFMGQVRREAERQRGREHVDRLGGKPSKDLETKFNGYKFKKVRKAGEGGFSTVWQVRGPTAVPDPQQPGQYIEVAESEQAFFAMKQVTLKKMERISREEVLEECNLLQTLAGKRNNEDFILRFFGWKSSTGSLKILLELGDHDFNHILRHGRLSRQHIMQYWQQMLEAVHFTHEEGNIVHTDLKPANFLMANGRLKLIDFGIAQKIPVGTIHIKRDAMIGTPNYMAPETVRAVKEAKREGRAGRVYKAGKASDVWALGCIFYQMVYNRPPFEAFHGDDKLKEILDPKHTIHYPPHRPAPVREGEDEDEGEDWRKSDEEVERVDDEMIDVMRLTFIYNAHDRVSIPALLQHAFLQPDQQEETVAISRATLKEILRKIHAFTRNGELHEDELDERGDTLFDNIRDKHLMAP